MATKGRQDGGAKRRKRIIIPDNVAEYYVNSLNVGTTAWDFMLFWGATTLPESLEAGGDESHQIDTRVDCVLRMSPQHAKVAVRALQNTVTEYERRFGEIQVPDQGRDQEGV